MDVSDGFVLLVAFGLAVYILPAWIAKIRNHHNTVMITFLTLVLGWSGIAWVVLLVYAALSSPTKDPAADGFE